MPIVLFGMAANHHPAIELLIYLLSSLYLLYGTMTQLNIMKSNIDCQYNECTLTPASQEEAWDFLYDFVITWISSSLFHVIPIRHWWKNEFTSYVTVGEVDMISWICILNAVTAAIGTSLLEVWFVSSISSDVGVFLYLCLSASLKCLQAVYQGTYIPSKFHDIVFTLIITISSQDIFMCLNGQRVIP